MTDLIVRCENLIKIYNEGEVAVVALQGLDFTMQQGEFVSILGKSGSGKSTLLKVLAGFETASAGRVDVAGSDLTDITQRELVSHYRTKVGFLWQDFGRNLLPYLKVSANIELPMLMAGVRPRERKRRVGELLEATGLRSKAHARVATMSGGEQQRLAMCVALAAEPRLLLADEPTGELDTQTSLEIYELLRRLCEERGLTVAVVTHDVVLAHRTDRVVRLRDGRMATEDRVERIEVGRDGSIRLPRDWLVEAGIEDVAEAWFESGGIVLRRDPLRREDGDG
jgi:putative ABC transport system ATP-binding protein